jgi:hypothetical protein
MRFGRIELKLNSKTLITMVEHYKDCTPTNEFPWITVALRVPSITLPFQRKNEFDEWERLFEISAPTFIQWGKTEDISWQFSKLILGFGISILYQYGY